MNLSNVIKGSYRQRSVGPHPYLPERSNELYGRSTE